MNCARPVVGHHWSRQYVVAVGVNLGASKESALQVYASTAGRALGVATAAGGCSVSWAVLWLTGAAGG